MPPLRIPSSNRALYFAPVKPKIPAPFDKTLRPLKVKSLAENDD